MTRDFTIVFEKLKELQILSSDATGQVLDAFFIAPDNLQEMDEISELRRLATEIIEPEPLSYTTT